MIDKHGIKHSPWCRDARGTSNSICDCGALTCSEGRFQRYHCTLSYGEPYMEEDDRGEWVRYKDIKHLLPAVES